MSKDTNGMNDRLIKAAAHLRLLVTGIAVTGGCGLLMLTDSAFNPAKREERPTAAKTVSAEDAKAAAKAAEVEKASTLAAEMVRQGFASGLELPEPTLKKMSFPKFKKAAIGEYDMSASETRSKGFKGGDGAITDPNDFTVPFPEQDTLIYYPEKGEPQNLTATRSVADEYFRIHDENSGSTLVLNGHELLCLMVNNEIGDSWGEDAIKAQIVAAYSYLRYNQEHGLTPTVGLRYGYSSKLEGYVESVEGQAMYYDGEIICAVYSASSAGYTTTAADIWGGNNYPYLKCVESEFDSQDVNWGFEKKYSKAEVKSMLESRFGITLSDDQTQWFTVDRAYSVVYIDTVTIDGRPECKLTGNQLCNLMGLRSNAITIEYKDGEFTFTSCGWGHGVGLSQWGAYYYAKNGWTYDQILRHYYVDADLALSDPSTHSADVNEVTEDDPSEWENDMTGFPELDPIGDGADLQPQPDDTQQLPQPDNAEQWSQPEDPETWQPDAWQPEQAPDDSGTWQPDDTQWSSEPSYEGDYADMGGQQLDY